MSTTAFAVTGVDFVSIPSRDPQALAAFYEDVLGLERSQAWQRGDEPPLGVEFETGTVTLALVSSAAIGLDFAPSRHPIALQVEDVHAARAALEQRGVVFGADTLDSGVCHMAFFKDPDGNALMLHARYAPR